MKKHAIYLILITILTIMGTSKIMANTAIKTQGIHHVGLAVKDLSVTAEFFIDTLNFEKVDERPDYPAIFVSDGTVLVTLWQVSDPESATPFDRKSNIGLHHLAFRLNSFEELDVMYEKLKARSDVEIEFAPELIGKGPAKHMIFREPGGIRLELSVFPN